MRRFIQNGGMMNGMCYLAFRKSDDGILCKKNRRNQMKGLEQACNSTRSWNLEVFVSSANRHDVFILFSPLVLYLHFSALRYYDWHA